MRLDEADQLLEPGYLPFEAGFRRLDDGQLHVAARTSMPACKGSMIDWWFGFVRIPEQYKWWHPRDHVWCDWTGCGPGEYVGGTHLVHEYIGGELAKLKIAFRESSEYLDVSRFAETAVGTAVCARVGALDAPIWTGHMIHLVRDTDYGCEMRSRFWIGDFDPPEIASTREERIERVPDALGRGLLKHCHEEMSYLAGFLPELYAKQNRHADE